MDIRPATSDDAGAIAVVHVRAWQQAYRGLMPQAVLDDLSIDDREAGWARILAEPDRPSQTIVAERDGAVAGWASFGAARDAEAPGSGELWGIYAHPDAWSTGVGHALITAVEDVLRSDGHEIAYLWVLEGNERAAGFYERHGWASDGARKVDERPGLVLHELRHVKRLD
ncbi:GNAT family N-acetyltransferase [Microbacterium esteraromaticum]|uniref:GNAT family N-acetyltransferase n=1 Tax=Microbacterium esteraromaticum TaxID=57043 RepID=A0A7D8AHU1_9MICO|nr:GNAT family N-acetyltransferase [Microbacterium esteraromaticum]QMU96345.1 GNAT family N-acetyltransferase [Microbacterium esteraromaticum]